MSTRQNLILIISLVLIPSTLYSDGRVKIAVFDFEPFGVDHATLQVGSILFIESLVGTGKFDVVRIEEEIKCYRVECAVEIGKNFGFEKAIVGRMVKLGEKLILTLNLIDIASGEIEFSDKFVCTSLEDLDTILERAAQGMAEKKSFIETADVGKITEMETEEVRRRKPYSSVGLRTGYLFPVSKSYGNVKKEMVTLDAVIFHEARDILVEGLGGVSATDHTSDWHFDLLLHKIFLTSDFAPYLGGGPGVHKVTVKVEDYYLSETKSDDGLALSISGGIIGFRTYDFRIFLSGKYTCTFVDIGNTSTQHGFSLTFGLTSPSMGKEGETFSILGGYLGLLLLCMVISAID